MYTKTEGLNSGEVRELAEKYGANVLPEKPRPGNFFIFLQQLKNPLIYVLLAAGIVTFLIGHFSDSLIILFAVLVNSLLGFVQERKAADALFALKSYMSSNVTVIRNGKRETVKTSELVPGDMVILSQGVKVPADGILTEVNRMYVDESVLTGESIAVEKVVESEVFMGTTVASGQGLMKVIRIGGSTKMGLIALQIQEEEDATPLQKQLAVFSRQLIYVVAGLVTVVFITGLLFKHDLKDIFTTSVALAVASIPEGLIISLTAVLAIGMQKILKRRGLVKKLAAAETLGGVNVVCVDKTGTLTLGQMTVTDYIGSEKELAEQALLSNDLDDPIVIAAFEWGRRTIKDFVSEHQRLDSIPFSPTERFFTSLHKWDKNGNRLYVNGAPEHILEWTTLKGDEKKKILEDINRLTCQGKRLVGYARKDTPLSKTEIDTPDVKGGLTWIGILAFTDPVRIGVKDALKEAENAGIKTIVITGDYAKTAQYVLSELGIEISEDQIITGDKLKNLNEHELAHQVKSIRLFARTTPDQKLKIVNAFKANGDVVAMMGDGVNDAPALHTADIGVAVGEATDVAKESSDLVLLDSNFATIVAAIEEGRGMFENIRKIILYLLSDAFAEIVIVFGGVLLGLPLPLTAVQILWINLVSDGLPNLALTVDPNRADIMEERPRSLREKLVNKWMIVLIGTVSMTAGLMALITFIWVLNNSGNVETARSAAFLTLGLISLGYVFSVRSLLVPFWKSGLSPNKWLLLAVAGGFVLQAIPFATPGLRNFFGLSALSINYWIAASAMSLAVFLLIEVFKQMYAQYRKIK
jgi:Ca2+-transporting ATPase